MFEKEAEEDLKKLLKRLKIKEKDLAENQPEILSWEKMNFVSLDVSNVSKAFQKGAEFGYNKANEWHYVKDGDLPNTETKDYTYIRRRKRYERQFTDYRVIKCYVLCQNEKGKITPEVGYFDCNKKCFLDKAEGKVIAWKEIVLPELKENE